MLMNNMNNIHYNAISGSDDETSEIWGGKHTLARISPQFTTTCQPHAVEYLFRSH